MFAVLAPTTPPPPSVCPDLKHGVSALLTRGEVFPPVWCMHGWALPSPQFFHRPDIYRSRFSLGGSASVAGSVNRVKGAQGGKCACLRVGLKP